MSKPRNILQENQLGYRCILFKTRYTEKVWRSWYYGMDTSLDEEITDDLNSIAITAAYRHNFFKNIKQFYEPSGCS